MDVRFYSLEGLGRQTIDAKKWLYKLNNNPLILKLFYTNPLLRQEW